MQVASIQAVQEMPQPIGIRPVLVGSELQLQRVGETQASDRTIEEPGELVYLEVGALQAEYRIASNQLSDERPSGCKFLDSFTFSCVLVLTSWCEHEDVHILELLRSGLDLALHKLPVESSVATAKRRQ